MAVELDKVVPWGRAHAEYHAMFDLASADMSSVLDCGGGPASFVAELAQQGISAVSVDPIYVHTGSEIERRFEENFEKIIGEATATPNDWSWTYHENPAALGLARRGALKAFLADYRAGLQVGRYRIGELPSLPFESDSFGMAVCSHFLFLYSHLLPEDFHVRAVLELCRVAREVRLFPLLTLRREPSPHLPAVMAALVARGYSVERVTVGYELLRGANQMLRIYRK
ncbi:MAG TPA: class I SAM-dependent methyltransferase [Candidatus Limnocylindria bacterium]|jgi:hypothetical protein|nr:class I SAM-dependent methyltransferase [Candidatus Limnocylindria bacterium]